MEEIMIIEDGVFTRENFKKYLEKTLDIYLKHQQNMSLRKNFFSAISLYPTGMCEILHTYLLSIVNSNDVVLKEAYLNYRGLLHVYYLDYVKSINVVYRGIDMGYGYWFGGLTSVNPRVFIKRRIEFLETLLKLY